MKRGIKTQIASKAEVSDSFVSRLLKGKKRPSWPTAKRLVKAVPGTTVDLWMDGTPDEIKAAIDAAAAEIEVDAA